MSNLSDDTLHKILQQIQGQALANQRSLSIVNAQLQGKARQKKILELTSQQLNAIPKSDDVKMYRGVGKMFLMQSRDSISAEQSAQDKSLKEEVENLTKKGKYLEKQIADAQNQLRDIFHHQQQQQ